MAPRGPTRSVLSRRRVLGMAGLVAVGTTVGAGSVLSHRGVPGGTLPAPAGSGAYVGAADTAALSAFGDWRGRPASFAVDYLARAHWTDVEAPTWWLENWSRAGVPLVLGVPMLLDRGTTLTEGAAGDYDASFRALARTLVAHGYARADLRVGWEMNGDWYTWSAARDPGTWVRYHRRVVDAMRSVDGQRFTFTWSTSTGPAAVPAELAWPGGDYVDAIGVDVYDSKWADPAASPRDRWTFLSTQDHGLDWALRFAAEKGKHLAVPEWGLDARPQDRGGGGGDDPYFVERVAAWVRENPVAYEAYFDEGTQAVRSAAFPGAAARYRALFGAH